MNLLKNKKSSIKKYLFVNLCIPIIIILFLIILSITLFLILDNNKKLNLFLINQVNLIANITENSKLYQIISNNQSIIKNASIVFRDPFLKYEIFFNKKPPLPLELFDQNFIEKKDGIIFYDNFKIFFAESFLSRICIIIIPKSFFYSYSIKISIIAFTTFSLLVVLLWFLLSKFEKKLTADLLKNYIFIKYLLEGKYNENQSISIFSEIDNIRYMLNNLVNVLKDRRAFYNSMLLFQKKILDIIPAGILIFNERDLFEDANNFGYAQIEREIKKKNIIVDDITTVLNEKLSLNSIVTEESISNLNENNVIELNLKPNISFTKRVFGKLIQGKKIIILVPLNITIEEERDDEIYYFKKSLVSFISDFAHEFRSPLNSILGFSQIITEGIEGENISEIINDSKIINESAQVMMAFVDDIIFLSRIDNKSYESIPILFNINTLFILINHYFKGIFKGKEIELVLEKEEEMVNIEINADFQSIRRIILLLFFYIRDVTPLPSKVIVTFIKENEKEIEVNVEYLSNFNSIKNADFSNRILKYCQDIGTKSSIDLLKKDDEKKSMDNKREVFTIKFSYKNSK